jgi:hypothetical protein
VKSVRICSPPLDHSPGIQNPVWVEAVLDSRGETCER